MENDGYWKKKKTQPLYLGQAQIVGCASLSPLGQAQMVGDALICHLGQAKTIMDFPTAWVTISLFTLSKYYSV